MFRKYIFLVVLFIILTGCAGCARFAETDTTQAAAAKKAIVLITPAGLDPNLQAFIKSTLLTWRQDKKIAYDWLQETKALDEPLLGNLAGKPIDQVIVIGNELIGQVDAAAKALPELKWTVLQSNIDRTGLTPPSAGNVNYQSVDLAPAIANYTSLIKQQIAAGASIQWVTRSLWPVPSEWAPSEEADHIVDLDVWGDQWFSQLTSQARSAGATQIIAFGPLQAAELNRVKTLRLPVVDLFGSLSVSIRWDAVFAAIYDSVAQDSWKPGNMPYSSEEATAAFK